MIVKTKFEENNGLNKVGYVEELYFNIPYILRFGRAFNRFDLLNTNFMTLCSSTEKWSKGICILSQKKRQNSSIGLLLNLSVFKKRSTFLSLDIGLSIGADSAACSCYSRMVLIILSQSLCMV